MSTIIFGRKVQNQATTSFNLRLKNRARIVCNFLLLQNITFLPLLVPLVAECLCWRDKFAIPVGIDVNEHPLRYD